jgi:hypothetical protein
MAKFLQPESALEYMVKELKQTAFAISNAVLPALQSINQTKCWNSYPIPGAAAVLLATYLIF